MSTTMRTLFRIYARHFKGLLIWRRRFVTLFNTFHLITLFSFSSPCTAKQLVNAQSNYELYLQARSSSSLDYFSNEMQNTLFAKTIQNRPLSRSSNHAFQQSTAKGNGATTEFRKKSNAPHSAKNQAARLASNTRISFEFQKVALPEVLRAFSAFTGANLIISERVHGDVSLKLENVPWREALDTLLITQGLAMQQRGHILWIAPASDIARQEQQYFDMQSRATDTAPLSISIFEMHYQRAEEVQALLNGSTEGASTGMARERFLSKRGVAMVDSRTNMLFVTDVAQHMERIKKLLAAIDRPVPQVSIEAQIVEAEEGFSRSLGARLSILGAVGKTPSMPDQEPNKDTGTGAPTAFSAPKLVEGEKGVLYDLAASALSGSNPASIGFTLFGAGASRIIALELSMLEAKGQGKILSSPRVVTANRVKAQIEQGTELPYQAKVGHGVSGVQFRRAGLRLEVTPHIMPNGYVTLDVDVSKDSVGEQTISGPAIHTKHVQTQVHVEDAGTVALGGIFTQDQRDDIVRLPWLGELPIVGALFRRTIKNQRKNELLIFITPHIIAKTPEPVHNPVAVNVFGASKS